MFGYAMFLFSFTCLLTCLLYLGMINEKLVGQKVVPAALFIVALIIGVFSEIGLRNVVKASRNSLKDK